MPRSPKIWSLKSHLLKLRETLARVHLIVESGGVGEVQATVFERIIAAGPRPWILRSPRPDVDWTTLETVFARDTYVEAARPACALPAMSRRQ